MRHYGVTPELALSYAQAAAVCLSRRDRPPIDVDISADVAPQRQYRVAWTAATARERATWNNDDDATRDGAYCIVLAAAEAHLGLVALARTKTKTGADYHVAPMATGIGPDGELDLETSIRLEVSGIDRCDSEAMLLRRLREKVEQAGRGKSPLPALAGVVGFSLHRIAFREA